MSPASPDTWVCIASGPSLTQAQADYCRGRARVMVINDGYRMAPWADALYSCDRHWWAHHIDAIRATFAGECWTRNAEAAREFGLYHIVSAKGEGLCREPTTINEGHNGGYQAMNLVWHFGARHIVLLGYDMQKTGGKKHWFGDHPGHMDRDAPFAKWIAAFEALARDLAADGCEVINATETSALGCFRRASLEDTL